MLAQRRNSIDLYNSDDMITLGAVPTFPSYDILHYYPFRMEFCASRSILKSSHLKYLLAPRLAPSCTV